MSWDLDAAEARELAGEYLAAMPPPGDDTWVITTVEERDWGWIVSWLNKRAAQGSTAIGDRSAGGGPFLIDRKTGRVAMCGSAHAAEYYVRAWQRGELTDLPRPA
ncbi:MAG: YrhB domain-containing protein [Trebonia sp.]